MFIPFKAEQREPGKGFAFYFTERAVDLPVQADIVKNRFPGKQKIVLRHIGKAFGNPVYGLSVYKDCPGARRENPGQKL